MLGRRLSYTCLYRQRTEIASRNQSAHPALPSRCQPPSSPTHLCTYVSTCSHCCLCVYGYFPRLSPLSPDLCSQYDQPALHHHYKRVILSMSPVCLGPKNLKAMLPKSSSFPSLAFLAYQNQSFGQTHPRRH